MATPGMLTDCVAWSLGLQESGVAYTWRVLRENGIVTKGGRGRSAAHVSATDAANLLIAVAATVPGRDTIDSWRDFAVLPAQAANVEGDFSERLPGIWRLQPLDLPSIRQLPEGHSFVSALAAFVSNFSDGSLEAAYRKIGHLDATGVPERFSIQVDLFWPLSAASIRIFSRGYSEQIFYRLKSFDAHDANLYLAGVRNHPFSNERRERGDLFQHRMFSGNTIIHVANVLSRRGETS